MQCYICQSKKTIDFFHSVENYDYYFCQSCRCLFIYPLPNKKTIADYYQKNFDYEPGRLNEEKIRKQAKKILSHLKKLQPQGKTLLDIGCGFGFLLAEAEKIGLKTTGIEPSIYLYNQAKKQLLKTNLLNTDWDSFYRRANQKFDFIVLSHVIEHLREPIKAIVQISQRLTKNGFFYLETNNLDSHLFYAEQKNYTFLTPPQHLWVFSLKTLKTIINQQPNLTMVKTSTYSHPEHLMGIVKIKLKSQNSKLKIKNTKTNSEKLKTNFFNLSIKNFKYLIFDRVMAPVLTPLLNLGGYGSILELYIKKKTGKC